MIDIGINKLEKSFGINKIFNQINLEIKEKEKIALIGDNGCGKTTLLNMIAGIEEYDNGNISFRKNIKVGYLKQIQDEEENDTLVKDIIYRGVKDILNLEEKLEKYEKELTNPNVKDLNKIIEKYSKIQDEYISKGGYELNSKIYKVIDAFKIKHELLNRTFNSLSGGEKTIVKFAALIIENPDVLLLDEPTNHLDIKTLEWLEEYLNNYNGTIVIVSHDRYFLDKVVNKIILIENGNIEIFNGNYSYFIEENDKRIDLLFKEYKERQRLISAMKKKIKQLEEFGRLGDNEIFFKRAENIRKRLNRLEEIEKPKIKNDLPISFNGTRSSNVLLDIKDINISYDDNVILRKSSMFLNYKERVGLIGDNGCGKSSIIKYLLNNKELFAKNVNIGYIPQEISFENNNITVLEEARKYFNGEIHHLRSALIKFYFYKDDIDKRIFQLSGGEKIRLKLFCLIQQNINLLILDEPTNHIDIKTKEVLEDALKNYKGTILFVSHDRYFINNLATRIIYFDNKVLRYIEGNYDYYKEKVK